MNNIIANITIMMIIMIITRRLLYGLATSTNVMEEEEELELEVAEEEIHRFIIITIKFIIIGIFL